MKKTFSILISILFLFNVSGYYAVFKIMQYNTRRDMAANISENRCDEETEKVVIPNNIIGSEGSDFHFVEENEFIYKGKLYDIVSQKTEGSNTIFYCINDKNEEGLFNGLKEHIKRNTDQNNSSRDRSHVLVENIIKEAIPEAYNKIDCKFTLKLLITFNYIAHLQQEAIPIFLPPPEI